MIKTAQQLKEDYLEIFPSLQNFWAFDPKYNIPTVPLLEDLVIQAKEHEFLKDYINRGPVEDCDNAALYSAAIIHYLSARANLTDPIAYGRAMGYKFRGQFGGHCLNTCVTEEGIHFIDFDSGGRIWKATSENDSIFYVELS